MLRGVSGILVLLLGGCVVPPERPVVYLTNAFDEAQASELLKPGTNVVRGSGFMRQQGGGVVTCAGNVVTLIPATRYAQERMAAIYGAGRVSSDRKITFSPEVSAYRSLTLTTRCNAQGGFAFERVADGDFFVVTTVSWVVANRAQGGAIYSPVTVRGGRAVEVTLAP